MELKDPGQWDANAREPLLSAQSTVAAVLPPVAGRTLKIGVPTEVTQVVSFDFAIAQILRAKRGLL